MMRSSELKLSQAGRRLGELERSVADFMQREPFSIQSEVSDNRRSYAIGLHVSITPPDHHLGPLIGEVVHNLGSALDAAAWEIAIAGIGDCQLPEHDVRFPIVRTDTPTSRRKLEKYLRPFDGVPDARELFELVQPREENGCLELALLDDLWNVDKHRGVHRTVPAQISGGGTSSSVFTQMPLDGDAPMSISVASGRSQTPHPAGWEPPWPSDGSWALAFCAVNLGGATWLRAFICRRSGHRHTSEHPYGGPRPNCPTAGPDTWHPTSVVN